MLFEDKATLHAKYTAACVLPSHAQHACSVLNVDVISFDLSERVMFQFKYNHIRQVYMHEKKQHTFLMFAYLPLVNTLLSGN